MNPSTAQATVLADEFVRLGLRQVCLAPGSRSAALALAAHARAELNIHVSIDERSAAFLALGIARASRRPAAVITTSGTAVANLYPAVIEASESGVPLLVMTADRPPELRGTGANQAIDQLKVFGDAVRWFSEVGIAENDPAAVPYWRSLAAQAWSRCQALPGPVHLNLPFREPLVPGTEGPPFDYPLEGRPGGQPWTRTVLSEPLPAGAVVDRLAEELAGAQRGMVVAGDTASGGAPLAALAEAAGWPLIAEPTSGARSGPNAITTAGVFLTNQGIARRLQPDLVIRVGRVVLSKALLAWLGPQIPQVLVDPFGRFLDPAHAVGRVIAADPALLARELARGLAPKAGSEWLASWQAVEARARAALDGVLDREASPSEPRVARDLAALLPSGTTLVAGSSMPIRDLDLTMASREGLAVLGNRGASGIDGFVSMALGVALERPAAALTGDLSLLHDQNGFLLDTRGDIDLPIVVCNNDGGGIFSFLPQAKIPDGFDRLFGTPHGRSLDRLAALHGLAYTKLERPDDLSALLAGTGVRLIEVRTDRHQNHELHVRIRDAIATAVSDLG